MPDASTIAVLAAVVALALAFDFINGFHDTAIAIATTVSTRVMTPRQAIVMAAVLNFFGALVSHNVAKTISSGLVHTTMIPEYVVIGTLLAAITWNLITWYYGIPSSSSHALIGGLVGGSIAYSMNLGIVQWSGIVEKVLIPLVTSPLVGFVLGFFFMKFLYKALAWASPQFVNRWFSKLQILSAASMAFGTAAGGMRIIKTMGVSMIKLQPVHGFAAQTTAAATIAVASAIGAPVSTTHVTSTAIMGVGASKRFSAVRWMVAKSIVWAWVITIPITAAMGALAVLAIKGVMALLHMG